MELADDAVETSCCHQILCERCSLEWEKTKGCPSCRNKEKLEYTLSHIVRRIVGNYPGVCKFCKEYKATRSDVKLHEKKCSQNPQREMKLVLEEEVKSIEAEI